ncbi:MAG: phospho-sugar mutase [Myxococcales bacterium]|nr:phospho-sugar mutase [Myxococcales bacterium]
MSADRNGNLDPDKEAAATLALTRAWRDADALYGHELDAPLAAAAQGEVAALAALKDQFVGELAFGTAGVRAEMGAGKLRLNTLTIRRLTTGLAAHLLAKYGAGCLVMVGHDARTHSRAFAIETAETLSAHGISVKLAEGIAPTPVIAWALLANKAQAAVVVTASHNPPRDNGYKVYAQNGAQIVPPDDIDIAARVAALPAIIAKLPPRAELIAAMPYRDVTGYDRAIAALPPTHRGGLAIAYTAMHGVGDAWVQRVLGAAGFVVTSEASQATPDGTFPTVAFPNPEEPGAMDRVLALGRATKADLVLANDPDADRLAVAIPSAAAASGFAMLSGDEVGALLADYLLANTSGKRLVATTLVSSQLLGKLAELYGVDYRETLTGFKWIANAAIKWEAETGGQFVFGYEEALGYTIGTAVRDKDGVAAALVFAELAAHNRAQGRTVAEHLADIRRRTGMYLTKQVSKAFAGAAGKTAMDELLATLRAKPPAHIASCAVTASDDLLIARGDAPTSNVLIYRLEGGHRVIVRPSGTEPKLKIYFEARSAATDVSAAQAEAAATLARLASGFLA